MRRWVTDRLVQTVRLVGASSQTPDCILHPCRHWICSVALLLLAEVCGKQRALRSNTLHLVVIFSLSFAWRQSTRHRSSVDLVGCVSRFSGCLFSLAVCVSPAAGQQEPVLLEPVLTAAETARVDDSGGERAPARMVAVQPFVNISQDAAHAWLGEGIAETVAADLEALGYLARLVRPASVSLLQDSVAISGGEAAAVTLGREAGAHFVLTGGYQVIGSRIRVTAKVVDVQNGLVVEAMTADGEIDEIFVLQDQIAVALMPLATVQTTNPQAPTQDFGGGEASEGGGSTSFVGSGNRDMVAGGALGAAGGLILPEAGTGDGDVTGLDVRRNEGPGGSRTESVVNSTPAAGVALAPVAGVLANRPRVVVERTTQPPTIDGALDDLVWQQATRITDFVQISPVEGAAATEQTDVFIAFDSTSLYLAMYAHYSNPGMVRANRVDRDRASFGDDTISVYFDPFLDQQRAFVFTLNGYGVQGDSLLGGGRGGGFRGGFTGVPRGDRSWDALFDSAGTLVGDGWIAEMAIPFKSLRYPATDGMHRWGFQIARSIRNKDETVVWAPVSRDVSGFLPQMGLLDGLIGLSTSRNLEILPTVTAIQAGSLDRTTGDFGEESQPEGGVNLKYGVTSNLTLDFTYNPDFSQIESDRPQIEVNQRFPLFFSELRPFFLEGQEIFDIRGPVNFIHTRTIVDPRYGGKLTGKVGKTTLGLLVANDEAPGKVNDPTDPAFGRSANTVLGRVRYDLYSESHVGAIVTDRGFLDSYSRLVGADGRFRVSPTASVDFAVLATQNRDLDGNETSGPMFDGGYRHNGRNLSYSTSLYSIAPDFDTAVGFVRRRDIRRVRSDVGYRWWPESWLINWGPEFDYSRNWNFDDVLEDEEARVRLRMTFAKNISFSTDVRREMERFGGINFWKTRYSYNTNVNTSRVFSFGGGFNWGDQVRYSSSPFLGDGVSGRMFMGLRPFSRLQSFININTSRLLDPLGESEVFDVKIYRAQTTYQFTDRLLLRNILEHNSFNGTLGANVLFTYRVNSGTVFYLGYDDRYQQGDLLFDDDDEPLFLASDFERTNRAFFTKISYLFRY